MKRGQTAVRAFSDEENDAACPSRVTWHLLDCSLLSVHAGLVNRLREAVCQQSRQVDKRGTCGITYDAMEAAVTEQPSSVRREAGSLQSSHHLHACELRPLSHDGTLDHDLVFDLQWTRAA